MSYPIINITDWVDVDKKMLKPLISNKIKYDGYIFVNKILPRFKNIYNYMSVSKLEGLQVILRTDVKETRCKSNAKYKKLRRASDMDKRVTPFNDALLTFIDSVFTISSAYNKYCHIADKNGDKYVMLYDEILALNTDIDNLFKSNDT